MGNSVYCNFNVIKQYCCTYSEIAAHRMWLIKDQTSNTKRILSQEQQPSDELKRQANYCLEELKFPSFLIRNVFCFFSRSSMQKMNLV